MTRPGIEPRSPRPLANTLTTGPMSGKDNYKTNKINNLAITVIHIHISIISNKIINFDSGMTFFL